MATCLLVLGDLVFYFQSCMSVVEEGDDTNPCRAGRARVSTDMF